MLIFMLSAILSACKIELYSQLTEKQANQMLAILVSGGIDTSKVALGKGMYEIKVEEDILATAVDLLNLHGLPGDSFASMAELYKKDGLISSPMEERIRYMFALSQSIAETLTNIDGVLVARVHVALPESDKYSGDTKPTSASVFIKHQSQFHPDSAIPEIKRIIESSIEGLLYERIAIFMSPAVSISSQEKKHDIVKYGPLEIGSNSLTTVKWLTALVLGILGALGFSTIWFASRLGIVKSITKIIFENEIILSGLSKIKSVTGKDFRLGVNKKNTLLSKERN